MFWNPKQYCSCFFFGKENPSQVATSVLSIGSCGGEAGGRGVSKGGTAYSMVPAHCGRLQQCCEGHILILPHVRIFMSCILGVQDVVYLVCYNIFVEIFHVTKSSTKSKQGVSRTWWASVQNFSCVSPGSMCKCKLQSVMNNIS